MKSFVPECFFFFILVFSTRFIRFELTDSNQVVIGGVLWEEKRERRSESEKKKKKKKRATGKMEAGREKRRGGEKK